MAGEGLTIVTFGVTPTSTVVALTAGDGLTRVTFGVTPTRTVVALTAGDGLTIVTFGVTPTSTVVALTAGALMAGEGLTMLHLADQQLHLELHLQAPLLH